MKTVAMYENLKEKEVCSLYESTYRGFPTYGIKINDIVLKDIYGDKNTVEGLVKAINKMMAGNKKAINLIKCMLVESTNAYDNDLSNF